MSMIFASFVLGFELIFLILSIYTLFEILNLLNFPKNVFNLKKLTEHTTIATSKKMKVELKQVATKTTKGND